MRKVILFICLALCLCLFVSCAEADVPDDNNNNNDNDITTPSGDCLKLDDSASGIVLLPDYKEYAGVTSLGNSTVKTLTFTAEEDGIIRIGAFTDVKAVPGFTLSSAIYVRDVKEYTVSAGENTIELDLELMKSESLYIGGNVSILYSDNGIPFSALSDNVTGDAVISDKMLGIDADIEYHSEERVFNSDSWEMSGLFIFYKKPVPDAELPCVYADTDAFAGKKITTIRIPVKKLDSTDETHSITLYKIKNNVTSDFAENCVAEYKIELSYPNLKGNEINYWYSADVSHLDITVAEDETLAFGSPDDTATFAVTINDVYPDQKYIKSSGEASNGCMLFDIYYRTIITKEEHLSYIDSLNEECKRDEVLKELIGGKTLSVIGDSVSVFNGISNGEGADTTNDTIRDNNGEYTGKSHRVYSADLTWWMKTVNDTNMRLLVNNASSGDHVLGGGKTRCEQLHDNTGDNAGEQPDIIAVLMGFNDINWAGVSPEQYYKGYDYMVSRIRECYPDADVFLFTYYHYNFRGILGTDEFLMPYIEKLRTVADDYGCTVVDLLNECDVTCDDFASFASDGIHPNVEGMAQISEAFKDTLYNKYSNS
ncbi:MAG: SGNH/GDSL hydrolase family protein [Clostridia bacterium]|nr:SGNH/GDSL hydrolase family protein [Clostridia bacterium]